MKSIIVYTKEVKAQNLYPKRIISPPTPNKCCPVRMEVLGRPRLDEQGRRFYYKRCKVCGCNAPGKAAYLPTVSIPAGLLDDDPGVRPLLHVFTSSRAPWWTITDNLPQHEKWVPGYEPKKAWAASVTALDKPRR